MSIIDPQGVFGCCQIHVCGGVGGKGKVCLITPLCKNDYPFLQVLDSIYFKPVSFILFKEKHFPQCTFSFIKENS